MLVKIKEPFCYISLHLTSGGVTSFLCLLTIYMFSSVSFLFISLDILVIISLLEGE